VVTDNQDMESAEVGKRIQNYLVENFLLGEKLSISPTTSLLGEGILDSTGVLELVTFLEQEFGVQVGDTEMVPENLDSLANLTAFVQRKLAIPMSGASCAQMAKPS
jgi:acyl carrier protein